MIEVNFHPIDDTKRQYLFVVIATKYKDQWVWVKHKKRETWEIPGGHVENGETVDYAAKRELMEETGAQKFTIKAICDYSVKIDKKEGFSRLYLAVVDEFGPLPESEIGSKAFYTNIPENLTHPQIQPKLFQKVIETI